MAGRLRLILALHNHQPVGNFDGVFEQSYQDSYLPFLNVIEEFPDIRFALHISGSLLEWLQEHHPEYVERVAGFVDRGQTEIIGGAFYEPILSNIPRRDRIGQIDSYRRHLERLFSTDVHGMWMPERVWEQAFAGDLTAAGVRYTLLDDHHFLSTGIAADRLTGYYITEDEGRLLSVFPGSERLRYLIPFRDPQETIHWLREIADRFDDPVVVFADDGEKFGMWPDTHQHVYVDGWLKRFLTALQDNRDWLTVTTPQETLAAVRPLGLCYLADGSYREMTEWVLDADDQNDLERLRHIDGDDNWKRLLQFVRGGFWRNFRVKYPESREMYARMMEVSTHLAAAERGETVDADVVSDARQFLYRAQCNCAWWHGAFGGLYLPHLRNAVYANLIEADTRLEHAQRDLTEWIDVSTGDYNLDTYEEVRISTHRLAAFFSPQAGGHLYELDVRPCRTNLLATLNRRPEPYHRRVIEYGQRLRSGQVHEDHHVASIHEIVRFKQPDLDRRIVYDRWPRKSLMDHFMDPAATAEAVRRGEGFLSDLSSVVCDMSVRRNDDEVLVQMSGPRSVGTQTVHIQKRVTMCRQRPAELLVEYELTNLPIGQPLHFAVEFNVATMPGGASDRYFYGSSGEQLGTLDACLDLSETDRIGLVDEWQGIDVAVEWAQPAGLWAFPIETISQSESGFELVHQSVALLPHWQICAEADGRWTMDLRFTVSTSLARARQLAEMGQRRENDAPAPKPPVTGPAD